MEKQKLLEIIDQLTPRYLLILNNMPSIKRKAFVSLLVLQTASARDIAINARLDSHRVSVFCARLEQDGLILSDGDKWQKLYSVRDPIFSLWYQLRRFQHSQPFIDSFLSRFPTLLDTAIVSPLQPLEYILALHASGL